MMKKETRMTIDDKEKKKLRYKDSGSVFFCTLVYSFYLNEGECFHGGLSSLKPSFFMPFFFNDVVLPLSNFSYTGETC